jgi:2,4-diketo-3-deoxy-L-fuconate hydrolase
MKLLRYGPPRSEKPGLLDSKGVIRDLSAHIPDISPETVTPKGLARIAALNSDALPIVDGTPRLGVPVKGIGKFIAIGLNYADHAKEANLPIPAEPPMFTKAISCLSGPNDDVMLPKDSLKSDWEVELGVIIGRTTRYVAEDKALDSVAVTYLPTTSRNAPFKWSEARNGTRARAVIRSDRWDRGWSRPTKSATCKSWICF